MADPTQGGDVGKKRYYFLTILAIVTLLGTVGFIVGFILHENKEPPGK